MRVIKMRNLVAASILAATTSGVPALTQAREVYVAIAPPATIVETVPAERRGHAWAPGYWRWNGHKHVWARGNYVRAQPGRHWVAHNWEQRGDRWYFHNGRWER